MIIGIKYYILVQSIYMKKNLANFKVKYNTDYWVAINYLYNDLFTIQKKKDFKYHINKLYHFSNIIILRAESEHAKIKYKLNYILTGMIKYLFF